MVPSFNVVINRNALRLLSRTTLFEKKGEIISFSSLAHKWNTAVHCDESVRALVNHHAAMRHHQRRCSKLLSSALSGIQRILARQRYAKTLQNMRFEVAHEGTTPSEAALMNMTSSSVPRRFLALSKVSKVTLQRRSLFDGFR